eukprot:891318_1
MGAICTSDRQEQFMINTVTANNIKPIEMEDERTNIETVQGEKEMQLNTNHSNQLQTINGTILEAWYTAGTKDIDIHNTDDIHALVVGSWCNSLTATLTATTDEFLLISTSEDESSDNETEQSKIETDNIDSDKDIMK